jgi:hypothetical protein
MPKMQPLVLLCVIVFYDKGYGPHQLEPFSKVGPLGSFTFYRCLPRFLRALICENDFHSTVFQRVLADFYSHLCFQTYFALLLA